MTSSDTAFERTLGYAQSDLDRLSVLRDDEAALAAMRDDPSSITVVLVGDLVLLDAGGSPCFPLAEPPLGPPRHVALLGRRGDGRAVFASGYDGVETERLHDLRGLAVQGALPAPEIGALSAAKALLHWHRTHGFCGVCGSATLVDQAGWRRRCPACGGLHFPRTDPVVIMMAVRGDRCLLGRQPRFPPGMYSCLAGFVEPGETLEAAVRREIAEEAGVATGTVRYLGSQPWPFPGSLMLGCVAEATSDVIAIGDNELEDARWVARAELAAMLDGVHPAGMTCPPPMSIAHHLMRHWCSFG